MADLADHLFAVDSRDTARVQEAHILAGHMICDWLELDVIERERGRLVDQALTGNFPAAEPPVQSKVADQEAGVL